jgi:hypothetical protein
MGCATSWQQRVWGALLHADAWCWLAGAMWLTCSVWRAVLSSPWFSFSSAYSVRFWARASRFFARFDRASAAWSRGVSGRLATAARYGRKAHARTGVRGLLLFGFHLVEPLLKAPDSHRNRLS